MPKLSQLIRGRQPYCVYCGGDEIGNSVDHVPPTSIFDGRDRPKGGEVTACAACHEGTRDIDAVVSFISRLFPSPTTEDQRKDIEKSTRGLIKRFPNLVAELGPPTSDDRYIQGGGTLSTGPIMTSIILNFGARMAFALHYNITASIVPPTGGAVVLWYSNMHLFENGLPDDLLAQLGPSYTLTQGRKNVGDQFSFAWVIPTDESIYGYWASFRKSFALAMFVSPSTRHLRRYRSNLFVPGFLKGYSVNALRPETVFDRFSTEGVGFGRFSGIDDS